MHVERTNQFEAGERVQGRFGSIVEQENLSIEKMLDIVVGQKPRRWRPRQGCNRGSTR